MWKKTHGEKPQWEVRIVEDLWIVWEYVCQQNCVVTFFLFFFERQRSNTSKQQIQMTLFEFKILFDPTLGLQGGDKVQDESDVER